MNNKSITIFVEGDEDVFIKAYLNHLFPETANSFNVKATGGWQKLYTDAVIIQMLIRNTDEKNISLVIFDADNNFLDRKKILESKKEELGIDFELFLFPNDNDLGDFETLLESIANPEHKVIFECFNQYQDCLALKNKEYSLPNKKAKIFSYLETLKQETKPKKRDYSVKKCWDLKSTKLESLKIFLSDYFG